MTNTEIIQAIKAEIERQMKFYDEKEMKAWDDSEQGDEDALWYQGHRKMCAKLLSFLDTLESEKPINQEGLEEEISRYLREECSDDDEPSISDVARHFAEWQKQEMLKEAVEAMVTTNLANRPVIYLDQLKGFQYGDKVRIIIVKEEEK